MTENIDKNPREFLKLHEELVRLLGEAVKERDQNRIFHLREILLEF